MKKLIFLLVISGIVYGSYRYSAPVYNFFLKAYYVHFKKENEPELSKHASRLYDEKKYEESRKLAQAGARIFPESFAIRKILGLSMIKLGERKKGGELIVSAIGENRLSAAELAVVSDILYEDENYGDLIPLLMRSGVDGDPVLQFYLGASFFKSGEYKKSLAYLSAARRAGKTGFEINYILGLSYEKNRMYKESAAALEEAHHYNDRAHDLNRALARVYSKLGRYSDAEKIVRRKL